MGFESEFAIVDNHQYMHVVFDDYKINFENEEESDDEEWDEELYELYEELWEETPYDIQYDWYQKDLDHPSLIPIINERLRHMPGLWVNKYYERM